MKSFAQTAALVTPDLIAMQGGDLIPLMALQLESPQLQLRTSQTPSARWRVREADLFTTIWQTAFTFEAIRFDLSLGQSQMPNEPASVAGSPYPIPAPKTPVPMVEFIIPHKPRDRLPVRLVLGSDEVGNIMRWRAIARRNAQSACSPKLGGPVVSNARDWLIHQCEKSC